MKKRNLFHHAGTTVALMIGATAVSKVLGMLRQMMTASIFAASMEGIAFSAASGIPLAIFDMLFSAAVLGSFLPIYKGHLGSDQKRAVLFSSSFFTCILWITAAVSVIGIVLARPIIRLSAPELDEETFRLAVVLLRIMFPSMIFAGTAYTLVGILQSHDRFLLPSLVSAVSNLILILYLAFCSEPIGATSAVGFAFAYVLSWMAQFLTLAVPLWRAQAFPRLTRRCKTEDTVLSVKRALPVMCGSWLIPTTTLIAKSFSSYVNPQQIAEGVYTGAAIVIFEHAFSVFSVAAGLLTYGVCNYIFPKLSARVASGDIQSFTRLLKSGFFISFVMILPVSGALFLLSQEIVNVLYLRGGFTEGLAFAAGDSLKMLALALPAYGMTEFFSRACYACGKVRYPMWASVAGISVALMSCGLLVMTERISVRTVSLSVALAQTVAGVFLLICSCCLFAHRDITVSNGKKYAFLLVGNVLCFAVMRLCRDFLRQIFHFSQLFRDFLMIAIVFAVGFVVYSIWMILMNVVCKCNLRTEYKNL